MPLTTRYNFNDNFSIEFGPQIGFLLNTKGEAFGQSGSSSGNLKFDIGPTLGIGYDIAEKFKLQLRYFIGLSDLLRTEGLIDSNQFDSVFQLSAGYVIF